MTAVAAFIYVRISADRLGTGLGVERQEAICRALCEAQGWVVGAVFVENDVSATSGKKRPQYEAMLARVRAGEARAIVCVDQDRLVRMMSELVPLLALCEETRTLLLLSSGEIDTTTADGIMRAQMLGVVADFETRKKKERQKRERAHAASRGTYHGGGRPFGFNDDGVTPRPDEWEAYEELFRRVIEGDGLMRIAKDWARRGIVAPRTGERFSTPSLKVLLRAPRAIGKRKHQGEIVGDAQWPAVVTPDVQQRALAALASRRPLRTVENSKRPARLLSSLVICGTCHQNMRVFNGGGARYKCHPSNPKSCGHVSIIAARLEPEVVKRFLGRLTEPETLDTINRVSAERQDVRDLVDEVELLNDELRQLALAKKAGPQHGGISLAEYLDFRKDTQARLDAAEAALADATNVPALLTISPSETVAYWQEFDLEEQRRRLAAFVECVIVRPQPEGFDPKVWLPKERVGVLWRI